MDAECAGRHRGWLCCLPKRSYSKRISRLCAAVWRILLRIFADVQDLRRARACHLSKWWFDRVYFAMTDPLFLLLFCTQRRPGRCIFKRRVPVYIWWVICGGTKLFLGIDARVYMTCADLENGGPRGPCDFWVLNKWLPRFWATLGFNVKKGQGYVRHNLMALVDKHCYIWHLYQCSACQRWLYQCSVF